MAEIEEKPNDGRTNQQALIVLGCPEVPVQQALALYCAYKLKEEGADPIIAGNPAVLQLLRVSDPARSYLGKLIDLDRCIEDLAAGNRQPSLCLAFAHSDAGITYATTIGYLVHGRLITVIFGRNAEDLAGQADIPGDRIVEKAVHNPRILRQKLDEVLGWAVSKT